MKCLIYCLRLSEKHDHSTQSEIYTSVQNTVKWVMLPLALADNELICDLTLNSIIGKKKIKRHLSHTLAKLSLYFIFHYIKESSGFLFAGFIVKTF